MDLLRQFSDDAIESSRNDIDICLFLSLSLSLSVRVSANINDEKLGVERVRLLLLRLIVDSKISDSTPNNRIYSATSINKCASGRREFHLEEHLETIQFDKYVYMIIKTKICFISD